MNRPSSETGKLRVMIAGGGTGGHVYPGIAIAKEVKNRFPEADIVFVGTESGLEVRIVPLEGFALEKISISGLKGVKGLKRLKSLLAIPKSLWESHQVIQRFRPQIVIGMGGYASGSPVLMAFLKGIPILLQEQNAMPGLTNRMLARFAKKVATAFRECEQFLGKKSVLTGNPIRPDFKCILRKTHTDEFVLLIFGGSQGAHAINQTMVEALKLLQPDFARMLFIHQTGEKDFKWVSNSYRELGARFDARPFFDDIPVQFAKASLILCRAGATTIAEITVAGKAAILVPFPMATDNHQQKNAEALVRAGAAEMILQKDLNGEMLAKKIKHYSLHREELQQMEEKSLSLSRPDSTERIVDLVEQLIHV